MLEMAYGVGGNSKIPALGLVFRSLCEEALALFGKKGVQFLHEIIKDLFVFLLENALAKPFHPLTVSQGHYRN